MCAHALMPMPAIRIFNVVFYKIDCTVIKVYCWLYLIRFFFSILFWVK